MSASYSVELLVALKSNWSTYLSCSPLGGDEKDSDTGSIKVKSAVKVHDPVLGSSVGWRILDLGPFNNKVGQGLRFDCRTWRKLNCEGAEFY